MNNQELTNEERQVLIEYIDGYFSLRQQGNVVIGDDKKDAVYRVALATLTDESVKADPNAPPAEIYAELYRLREEVKGPDGFATWKDAAIAERLSKKVAVNIPNEIDYLTAMSAFHSDEWHRMGPITGYMHGWNARHAEALRMDAVPPVQGSEELSRLRDWIKCVEAERDKAIAWHSSLLKKYEQLKAAQAGGEVAEVARAALDYIDALPSEVVAALPAMPGFDRDWAEGVLKHETD